MYYIPFRQKSFLQLEFSLTRREVVHTRVSCFAVGICLYLCLCGVPANLKYYPSVLLCSGKDCSGLFLQYCLWQASVKRTENAFC